MSTLTPPGPRASHPPVLDVGSKQSGVSLLRLPDEMIEHIASSLSQEDKYSWNQRGLRMLAATNKRLRMLVLPLQWRVRRVLLAQSCSRRSQSATNTAELVPADS